MQGCVHEGIRRDAEREHGAVARESVQRYRLLAEERPALIAAVLRRDVRLPVLRVCHVPSVILWNAAHDLSASVAQPREVGRARSIRDDDPDVTYLAHRPPPFGPRGSTVSGRQW